jgi:hypothetical protein
MSQIRARQNRRQRLSVRCSMGHRRFCRRTPAVVGRLMKTRAWALCSSIDQALIITVLAQDPDRYLVAQADKILQQTILDVNQYHEAYSELSLHGADIPPPTLLIRNRGSSTTTLTTKNQALDHAR